MSDHVVEVCAAVRISVAEGSDAVSRYVGLSPEEAKEWYTVPGLTEQEVLENIAKTYAWVGYDDLSSYDGWADIAPGEVTMWIEYVEVC